MAMQPMQGGQMEQDEDMDSKMMDMMVQMRAMMDQMIKMMETEGKSAGFASVDKEY